MTFEERVEILSEAEQGEFYGPPGFHQIKQDLKYVHHTVLSGPGCRPFNRTTKENERVYQRIFQLCNYQR